MVLGVHHFHTELRASPLLQPLPAAEDVGVNPGWGWVLCLQPHAWKEGVWCQAAFSSTGVFLSQACELQEVEGLSFPVFLSGMFGTQ